MFLDASVVVAILGREAGHEEIEKRLAVFGGPFFFSPLVRFEASVALARQKTTAAAATARSRAGLVRQAQAAVDAFFNAIEAEEVAISPEIGHRALDACVAYGRAVGHPADLNFGDCFAYACAKSLAVGMLYKGDDFARTDLA